MSTEINLPISYMSQWDQQANEDAADSCGPDCVAMVLRFYGEKDITSNQVFEKTGASKGQLITIPQLEKAIASFGYTSEFKTGVTTDTVLSLLKQGIAPIVLVHYESLHSREDQNYKGPHFMVIDGIRDDGIFANDPDFFAQFRTDGDHHFYTMDDFLNAWKSCHLDNNPDNSLLIIYPRTHPAAIAIGAAQTATIQAAVAAAAQATPAEPNLQDKYDHVQKLLIDVCTTAGAESVGDRDAMTAVAIKNIQSLKDIEVKDTQTLLSLKAEGGK